MNLCRLKYNTSGADSFYKWLCDETENGLLFAQTIRGFSNQGTTEKGEKADSGWKNKSKTRNTISAFNRVRVERILRSLLTFPFIYNRIDTNPYARDTIPRFVVLLSISLRLLQNLLLHFWIIFPRKIASFSLLPWLPKNPVYLILVRTVLRVKLFISISSATSNSPDIKIFI